MTARRKQTEAQQDSTMNANLARATTRWNRGSSSAAPRVPGLRRAANAVGRVVRKVTAGLIPGPSEAQAKARGRDAYTSGKIADAADESARRRETRMDLLVKQTDKGGAAKLRSKGRG